jgi:tetratricopeptide (TPR) repeat protein
MEAEHRPDSELDTFFRAEALLALTHLAGVLGDVQKAMTSISQSLALCEKMDDATRTPLIAESYHKLGMGALYNGDINQARIMAEKSLELFQRSGNKFGIAEVQSNVLTAIAVRSGDLDAARLISESTLAIRKELGDKDGIAFELNNAGLISLGLSDYDRAIKSFKATVEASRETRSDYILGYALGNLGVAYLFKGNMDLARAYLLRVAKLAQEKWNPVHKATSIYWLAMYSFEQKQFRKFIQLNSYLETEKSHLVYLYFLPQIIPATFQSNVATVHVQLDEESLNSAEAEGKAMTLDQAFAYALEGINE